MNPYWGKDFIGFVFLFFARLKLFLSGELKWDQLASDEIQIGVLIAIGIASALVGVFLVLKKMTMMANALSHTVLLGLVFSWLLMRSHAEGGVFTFNTSMLLLAAFITAILTVSLVEGCQRLFKLQEDASIGLVFTFLFALGMAFVTLYCRNTHLGVEAIMGNIDALHAQDLVLSFSVLGVNIVVTTLLFQHYKIQAFDATFARCVQKAPLVLQCVLMLQTALTAVASFRAVGVFLFLIFLTAPALSAKLMTKKLKTLTAYAIVMSVGCSFISVALARHLLSVYGLALSTAALACVNMALTYPLVLSFLKIKIGIVKLLQKRRVHKLVLKEDTSSSL